MAEGGNSVSACGDCKNCSDRVSALHDHRNGAADKNPEKLYDTGSSRRSACFRRLFFNRQSQYGYHYFRHYRRSYFYCSSEYKAVSQHCGGGRGSCGGNCNASVSYGRPGNK